MFVTHGQSRDSVLANAFGVGDENWSARRLAINIVGTTAMATNATLAELTNVRAVPLSFDRSTPIRSELDLALLGALQPQLAAR